MYYDAAVAVAERVKSVSDARVSLWLNGHFVERKYCRCVLYRERELTWRNGESEIMESIIVALNFGKIIIKGTMRSTRMWDAVKEINVVFLVLEDSAEFSEIKCITHTV